MISAGLLSFKRGSSRRELSSEGEKAEGDCGGGKGYVVGAAVVEECEWMDTDGVGRLKGKDEGRALVLGRYDDCDWIRFWCS